MLVKALQSVTHGQCDDYPSYRASLPLTDTKLCCLVTDTDDQVTLGCYLTAERPGMELAIFGVVNPVPYPLHHQATQ